MSRPAPALVFLLSACVAAAMVAGCGTQKAESDPGAQLFSQRCGGCHSLDAAGTW